MRDILTSIASFFQLTRQEKTVAVFLLVSVAVGNVVLFVKRKKASFATDLVVSEQLTLEELSRTSASLGERGTEYLKVNLNTANVEELQLLPGVGPATARRIVSYRDSAGPFGTPEDLMKVKGIGHAKYRRLKESVVAPQSKLR